MTSVTTSRLALATALCLAAGTSHAQVFHSTDGSIQGSLCVGFSCTSNESFGSDTLRLKEDNVSIHFEDASASSSFPTNDWRITINDSGNGGRDYFAIDDASADRTVFEIEAGARSNALYIDDDRHVGFGTNAPVVNLHVVEGNTPALRLQQDGSNGFQEQIWDIAGNETNFFIRDVTGGSRLPFKIIPDAPTNSLVVGSDGNVGSGAGTSPEAPLHVRRAFGTASDMFLLENNGGVVFRLRDTSTDGQEFTFQSNGGIFRIASPAVPGPEFTMDDFGNVTITGEITTSGSCTVGCDRVFDADYELKPLAVHNAMMWEKKHLPNVGPTAEDGPMNLSEKVGGILNELEHAHIYIGQLHERIEMQDALNSELLDRLSALEAQIAAE